ncbi:hypothetical protein C5E41_02245 [Nocardia nova]|nr:hypothetical protein C5E41_02245 [Nocardia nova]
MRLCRENTARRFDMAVRHGQNVGARQLFEARIASTNLDIDRDARGCILIDVASPQCAWH